MTDTRDYRQYTTYGATSSLINSFDFDRNAAAKAKPQRQPSAPPRAKVREGAGIKSRQQLRKEERLSTAAIIRVAFASLICLALIGAVLHSFAVKNQLTRENTKMETAIANAQSEHISLESKLNSLVSISMIDKYAVEQLGMSKVHSNQIQYMDVDEYKAEREADLAQTEAAATNEEAETGAEETVDPAAQESAVEAAEEVINE